MINFDYNIYSDVKNIPYMHKGTNIDMVKYVNAFDTDNENFVFNDNIIINNITKLDISKFVIFNKIKNLFYPSIYIWCNLFLFNLFVNIKIKIEIKINLI